jgi:hypothetical protein
MIEISKTIYDAVGSSCELCILYRGICYLECVLIDEDLKT